MKVTEELRKSRERTKEMNLNRAKLKELMVAVFGQDVKRDTRTVCWSDIPGCTNHESHQHTFKFACRVFQRSEGWYLNRQLVAISGEVLWAMFDELDDMHRFNLAASLSEKLDWARDHNLALKFTPFPQAYTYEEGSGHLHLVLIPRHLDGRFDAALQRLMETEPR